MLSIPHLDHLFKFTNSLGQAVHPYAKLLHPGVNGCLANDGIYYVAHGIIGMAAMAVCCPWSSDSSRMHQI